MVENNIKKYLSFLKLFKELLTNIVNVSNHTKYVSLSNQQWKTQPTLINLYPKKYSHGSCYYSFEVNLGRCVGSCNTFNDLSNKVCVPNKKKDLNLSPFNVIIGMNEMKTLTKYILCERRFVDISYQFDCRKQNSNQKWNIDKC